MITVELQINEDSIPENFSFDYQNQLPKYRDFIEGLLNHAIGEQFGSHLDGIRFILEYMVADVPTRLIILHIPAEIANDLRHALNYLPLPQVIML